MLKLHSNPTAQSLTRLRTPAHPLDVAIRSLARRAQSLSLSHVQVDLGETFGNRFLLVWHNRPRGFNATRYRAFWQDVAEVVCNHGPRVDDTLHVFPQRSVSQGSSASAEFWVVGGDGRLATHCANGLMYAGQRWHTLWGARRIAFRCGQQTRWVQAIGESARVNLGQPRALANRQLAVANLAASPLLVNTGEPHSVSFTEDLAVPHGASQKAFLDIGRAVCKAWSPEGINWNLVTVGDTGLQIRTFERGVRRATSSCGTGSAASFYAAHTLGRWSNDEAPVSSAGGSHLVSIYRDELFVAARPTHHRTLTLIDYLTHFAAS